MPWAASFRARSGESAELTTIRNRGLRLLLELAEQSLAPVSSVAASGFGAEVRGTVAGVPVMELRATVGRAGIRLSASPLGMADEPEPFYCHFPGQAPPLLPHVDLALTVTSDREWSWALDDPLAELTQALTSLWEDFRSALARQWESAAADWLCLGEALVGGENFQRWHLSSDKALPPGLQAPAAFDDALNFHMIPGWFVAAVIGFAPVADLWSNARWHDPIIELGRRARARLSQA